MTPLQISLIVICSILAVVFIVVRTLKGGHLGFVLKTLASTAFVISGIIGLGSSTTGSWASILLVMGLLFGLIGDMVLDLKVIYPDSDKVYLNTGMLSFFLGHICYITAFSLMADINILVPMLIALGCSVALSAFTMFSGKNMMHLNFNGYFLQATAYSFILNFALIYALVLSIMGARLWLATIGLLLFLLSDLVLSMQYFGGKIASRPLIAINHTLYYMAQIIILAVLLGL